MISVAEQRPDAPYYSQAYLTIQKRLAYNLKANMHLQILFSVKFLFEWITVEWQLSFSMS